MPAYDLLIKNGTVIDGTGRKRFQADVAVSEGKIAKVAVIPDTEARAVIDAKDKFVAPGFIDILNHSDTYLTLLTMPGQESLLYQGIATVIGGNCGSSLAPLVSGAVIKTIQKWTSVQAMNVNWQTFSEYLETLEKNRLGVNFGSLVGHATLRRGILKEEFRPLRQSEFDDMSFLLEAAMDEGAFGLSTGLSYSHAKIAPTEEITDLAAIVARYGGVYATHVRAESDELLDAITETVKIAHDSGASLEVSHLKAMGRKYWGNFEGAIALLEDARDAGVELHFDVHPYTVTGSVLYVLLPDWVVEGGRRRMLERLKNPETAAKAKEDLDALGFDYDRIMIGSTHADKTFVGKTVAQIAARQGVSATEAIIKLLIAAEGQVITLSDVLSEDNVRLGVTHPKSFVVSDGQGYALMHRESGELVHPRCFGAFPRLLAEYVRRQHLLNWEEAIWKITGGPAEKYHLAGRGTIARGAWADVVVFDPQTIAERATLTNPYQYAQGVEHLLINGISVIARGEHTGARAGRVLRRNEH
ncbi:D-aminoacylase [Candidatus Parcubacteria bacterium]|nr:D-aminoacylase [Candidatus Parcubacteria bacterium]